MEKGRNAPVSEPFSENWYAIEYFYLGLVRDAPDRVEQLSAYIPRNPAEEFIKFSQFGLFLMAAYQTPYEKIQSALYRAFKDTAVDYTKTVNGKSKGWLARLPELQVLALFTHFVRNAYGYDFFRPALVNARLEAELDSGLDETEKVVLIFLADATLASLNDPSAFKALVDRHEVHMGWAVRLGISYASDEVSFVNDATRRIEKKVKKTLSNNKGLFPYLRMLEETPIAERKDLETKREAT